jgi:hypothetical protein
VLRKFKAGHTISAHVHPDANEWAYQAGIIFDRLRITHYALC